MLEAMLEPTSTFYATWTFPKFGTEVLLEPAYPHNLPQEGWTCELCAAGLAAHFSADGGCRWCSVKARFTRALGNFTSDPEGAYPQEHLIFEVSTEEGQIFKVKLYYYTDEGVAVTTATEEELAQMRPLRESELEEARSAGYDV